MKPTVRAKGPQFLGPGTVLLTILFVCWVGAGGHGVFGCRRGAPR
jgi:hypothetical protein